MRATTPEDIAIDCGANVGIFTAQMARTGARVYAFEPNPVAFAKLQEEVGGRPNVELINAATSTQQGHVNLYMRKRAHIDPLLYSVSSSMIESKSNVNKQDYIQVEAIGLADFIEKLDRPIKLLKMDVEGAEIALINDLLDRGLHKKIEQAFVEVHDRRISELAEATQALRQRLIAENAEHITLDWR
ncbi:MAG: FkbM family methyltransferase [Idiomarina sp.]|nr:FkbM family methyltransferase [Idiomarina sp.]